ncbi:MAG: enoyl-CoA hydratase-related protein [Armatimonadota bacterium]|nr:enoyl-CoA hydratase-related protein [Armatimonadota bacterium]
MSDVLRLLRQGPALHVLLARPEVHNALDARLIAALTEAFTAAAADPAVRYVVLAGEGPSFCAGADLGWMRASLDLPADENRADAARLAAMLDALVACPKPVIASVHGATLGGGVGLVAACDLAVATPDATFGLTEVRLGLVPAMIFPFLLRKAVRHLVLQAALTGERFGVAQAQAMGLVNAVAEDRGVVIARWAQAVLAAGPQALGGVKALFAAVPQLSWEDARRYTVDLIARVRAGAEAQEGMRAFLERRRPAWGSDETGAAGPGGR